MNHQIVKALIGTLAITTLGISSNITANAKTNSNVNSSKDSNIMSFVNTNYYVDNTPVSQFVAKQNIPAKVDGSGQSQVIKSGTIMTVQSKNNDGASVVSIPNQTERLVVQNIDAVSYSNGTYNYTKKDYQKLKQAGNKWGQGLSQKAVKAVGDYTDSGYTAMNGYLRNPQAKVSKQTINQTNLVQNSLKQFNLTKPITLYRGTSNKGYEIALNHQPSQIGAVYQDKGMGSTSISQSIANQFQSDVMLKINLPAGQYGAYIESLSKNPSEKEFLLNPNLKFVVTRIQEVEYQRNISNTQWAKGQKAKTSTLDRNGSYKLITLTPVNE
ncbi:ADP-ribosyltransferase [Lactobacillaceae bacterium Scapto_B20]